MKNIPALGLIIVLAIAPSMLLGKGVTSKITIEGPDLAQPIEITEPKILANFNVWSGPGTSSSELGSSVNVPSFIIDWSQGPRTQPPLAVQRYQVTFYSKEPSERPIYVVYYTVIPGSERGYVYLPGKSDQWWSLNVGSIVRGVEGKWFSAWSTWESLARPLIEKARLTKSSSR